MSSEIHVKLKAKGQSHADAITLLYLSTSATRELRQDVDLVYNGGVSLFEDEIKIENKSEEDVAHEKEYGRYTVLTKDKLNEIISFYDTKIKETTEYVNDDIKNMDKLEKMLPQSVSVDVYEKLIDNIRNLAETVSFYKERLEEYCLYKNKWLFCVQDVFESNEVYSGIFSEFELIYYMD